MCVLCRTRNDAFSNQHILIPPSFGGPQKSLHSLHTALQPSLSDSSLIVLHDQTSRSADQNPMQGFKQPLSSHAASGQLFEDAYLSAVHLDSSSSKKAENSSVLSCGDESKKPLLNICNKNQDKHSYKMSRASDVNNSCTQNQNESSSKLTEVSSKLQPIGASAIHSERSRLAEVQKEDVLKGLVQRSGSCSNFYSPDAAVLQKKYDTSSYENGSTRSGSPSVEESHAVGQLLMIRHVLEPMYLSGSVDSIVDDISDNEASHKLNDSRSLLTSTEQTAAFGLNCSSTGKYITPLLNHQMKQNKDFVLTVGVVDNGCCDDELITEENCEEDKLLRESVFDCDNVLEKPIATLTDISVTNCDNAET